MMSFLAPFAKSIAPPTPSSGFPGTAQLAKAYLDYLYSDEAQEIAAKHAIRPRSEKVLKKYEATFKPLKQFTVAKYFGSLTEAQKVHFNDGGQFDKLYSTK